MKLAPTRLVSDYTKPYAKRFPEEFGNRCQRQVNGSVGERTAWTAVDYVKVGTDLELEYGVLCKLCAEMLDANCAGLYLPRDKVSFLTTALYARSCSACGSRPLR